MKKTLKKAIGTILIIIFLISGLSASTLNVQAASKMAKTDFTKSYGTYKINFIKSYKDYPCGFNYFSLLYQVNQPGKLFRTKRNIALTATKKAVVKAYGKTKFKKVNVKTDNFYYVLKNKDYTTQSKLVKSSKTYADYKCKVGKDMYTLRFYFDKNKKVRIIVYLKNYSYFKQATW